MKRYSLIYIILTKGGVIIYYNEALLKQLRSGNKDAEEELIRQNTPLVYRLVKDYYYACKEPEDMKDIFILGLQTAWLCELLNFYSTKFENFVHSLFCPIFHGLNVVCISLKNCLYGIACKSGNCLNIKPV